MSLGRKKTRLVKLEGGREELFFAFLKELFFSKSNNIHLIPESLKSGTPCRMLMTTLARLKPNSRDGIDEGYLIIDNDTPLNKLTDQQSLKIVKDMLKTKWGIRTSIPDDITMRELAKLNVNNLSPFIIATEPTNTDGFILSILGVTIVQRRNITKEYKEQLKAQCDELIGIDPNEPKHIKEEKTMEFYRNNLTKEELQTIAQTNPILQSMISIIVDQ